MNPPEVLRVNALRRRAVALGTDVFHVVAFDATEQRETQADDEQREESLPAALKVGA
jgi:hypothetical protein